MLFGLSYLDTSCGDPHPCITWPVGFQLFLTGLCFRLAVFHFDSDDNTIVMRCLSDSTIKSCKMSAPAVLLLFPTYNQSWPYQLFWMCEKSRLDDICMKTYTYVEHQHSHISSKCNHGKCLCSDLSKTNVVIVHFFLSLLWNCSIFVLWSNITSTCWKNIKFVTSKHL